MKSRAAYALVGLSALAVVATLLGIVFWFSSGGGTKKVDVQVIFKDKVSGLTRGSSVLFNGLVVGEVIQMSIRPDDTRQISALIRVDQSTPLRIDTRARIEAQGLAGVVVVQLLGGDARAAVLTPKASESLPTISAEPSEDILETVRRVAKGVDDALSGLEGFVRDNSSTVSETIRRGEQFSVELADNSGSIEKLMQSIGAVANFLAPLPQTLSTFGQELTETLRSVDRQSVASVVDNVDKFTSTLGGVEVDVSKTVKNVASMTQKLNRAADQVEGVLKGAQAFLSSANGQDGSFFSDVSEVAKSIRVLADSLDKRSAEITKEIARFTNAGLGTFKTFATDGQRALTGISRALRDVDRNPQQLIFGNKNQLPRYGGSP
jgi:phospholipid/cholesterol/gamma-HCH transport system substrate-binding protein